MSIEKEIVNFFLKIHISNDNSIQSMKALISGKTPIYVVFVKLNVAEIRKTVTKKT